MADKKPLNISEEAAVQMPMKTVASLIIIVALGTWDKVTFSAMKLTVLKYMKLIIIIISKLSA